MSGLHVGFVIDGLALGGAEKVTLTLAEEMRRQSHRVTLVSLRDEQAWPVPDGVDFLPVYDRYRGPLHRQTEIMRRARDLESTLLKRFGPRPFDLAFSVLPKTDRIVINTPALKDAWLCLHGAVAFTMLGRKHGFRHYLKKRQLHATYHQRRWLGVSSGLLGDLSERTGALPRAHAVIPNPFDFNAIRQQAQEACPMEGENFLLHVGRFHPVKRHDRLLDAFLLSRFEGKLVLLGQGTPEQEAQIEHLIRSRQLEARVIRAGRQPNPFSWMRAARALVLSSDSEGFGNVLLEALACNTPVVSTNCPFGPADILQGDLACSLAALSAPALAGAINAILQRPPTLPAGFFDRYETASVTRRYLELATAQIS